MTEDNGPDLDERVKKKYDELGFNAQLIVDFVRGSPGGYFKTPLLRELTSGDIPAQEAIDSFNAARASGLIKPETLVMSPNGPKDSGAYYPVFEFDEMLKYAQDLNNP
tara:strand:+ start:5666 stop:5989 length:324 start_codon:yes stop_codon:yes gene_type:complete